MGAPAGGVQSKPSRVRRTSPMVDLAAMAAAESKLPAQQDRSGRRGLPGARRSVTRPGTWLRPTRAVVAGCALFASLFVTPVPACTVCVPYPELSLADRIIESTILVLAREDPNEPFSYAPVEVLKGQLDGSKLDSFLDSSTRRVLAKYADRYSVLGRRSADEKWQRLIGVTDDATEAALREIVRRSSDWRVLATDDPGRLEYFSTLLGHDSRTLHELAYLEIGRAPYGVIRDLSGAVPLEDIHAFLANNTYIEWHALYILMLGHLGGPEDREQIRRRVRSAARFDLKLNLSAWLTAYLEIDGAEAVAFIEQNYLASRRADSGLLKEALTALSVHGTEGRVELRDRIVTAYGTLLDVHPSMATPVANDLVTWQRSEHVDSLTRIRQSLADHDPLGAYAIERYLQSTRDRG